MTPSEDRARLYAFRRNLVVAASAGTGKTHALVGVLVHLALGATERKHGGLADPVPLARVVATTFSRKAAAEIRARLVRELTRLASGDPEAAYRQDLLVACDRAGVPRFGADELRARARRAIDGVSEARIGTLHGFAATIVRDHGLAAGWAPGFALEAEEETEERGREAAFGALERLLAEDEAGARGLLRLSGGVTPLVERTATIVARLGEDGRGASSLCLPTDDLRAIEAKVDALVSHARALCSDASLGPAARSLCDAWASADEDRIEGAASDLFAIGARGRATDGAQAFFEFRAGLPGTNHAERGRNLVRLWRARHAVLPRATLFKTLLVRAEAALRASMLRDSVLGYADVLRAARDTLASETTAALDLGRGLDALLIDELQDTSRVQREIVELAWQDPATAGRARELPRIARVRGQGLLVVGDRKQSIYAFRGADVGSFAELCVGLAGRPARQALRVPPGRVWEPEEPIADFIALRENRRSAPEILSFVNAYSKLRLVATHEPAELYEIEYAPLLEDLSFAGEASAASPDAGAGPRVSWMVVPPERGAAASRVREAEVIAQRIEVMLERGSPRARGEAPRPKDIAVLAVRNVMLDATAYALAKIGIPYVIAGNGFFAAREVQDMLAMLAFVIDPEDVLARVAVLRGVWCGASDESLVALTDPHAGVADIAEWDRGVRRANVRAEDRPRLDALRSVVLGLRGASASIGPAETLRQASRALDLEEALLLLPRGQQRVANVRKLVTLAEREPDARAFLARVKRASDEERPEPEAATFSEEDDAVRLLTVHASKGLDFPIVFLPEAGAASRAPERSPFMLRLGADGAALALRAEDEDGRTHETPACAEAQADAAHRERAEWARLAYVAATRARDAMIFVGDRRAPKVGQTTAYRSTAAASLAALAEAREGETPLLAVESDFVPGLRRVGNASFALMAQRRPALRPPFPRSVALTAAELADFAVCPRRYQLARLLGLPEPVEDRPSVHARLDAYAARAIRDGGTAERGRAFLVRASAAGASRGVGETAHELTVSVHGAIDLWIERPEGASESILSSTDPERDSPREVVLAAIVELAAADQKNHRTGLFFGARNDEPVWRSRPAPGVAEETRRRIVTWVGASVEARASGRFPRAPIETCRAIGCGFVSLCHG